MNSSLASLFLEKNKNNVLSDPWTMATMSFLQDQMISYKTIEQIISSIISINIVTENEYHLFLRKFLSLVLFCLSQKEKDLSFFNPLIKKAQSFDHYCWFLPAKYIKGFIFFLLKKDNNLCLSLTDETVLLPSDKNYYLHYLVPNIVHWCEMTTILLLFGIANNDEKLFNKAKKSAIAISNFIDSDNFPALSLWASDRNFDFIKSLCFFSLLFEGIQNLISSSFEKVLKNLLEEIEKQDERIFLFPVILSKWIQNLSSQKNDIQNNNSFSFASIATVGFKGEDNFSVFTLSGINSGMGAIHVGDVKILSFGPLMYPLCDMRNYGIFRQMHNLKSFDDIKIKAEDDFCSISGWTRLCSERSNEIEGSDLWINLKAMANDKNTNLVFDFAPQKINRSLTLTFFIKAKSCLVDDTTLLPSSLDRFEGKMPKQLSFRGKKRSISIKTKNEEKVQIIPLAGENCFWNANFLLAIDPFFQKGECKIIIEKV